MPCRLSVLRWVRFLATLMSINGPSDPPALSPLYRDHSRVYAGQRYVYPVLSRRSRGISIGVNLNPDKVCNFDCIYCQVDRSQPSPVREVDRPGLLAELEQTLDLVVSGRLFETVEFHGTPLPLRRLNDIAFSGDGEPTTYREFESLAAEVAALKRARGLADVKLVLITNATMLHRPGVARALAIFDANQGEIWAKLEAGTEEYYRLIERTTIPFEQILGNITAAARVRPLVIQALFMRVHGQAPPATEIDAFCRRLNEITTAGGRLALVQIYTVARRPAEDFVAHLTPAEVGEIAERVRGATGLTVAEYYGPE